MLASVGPEDSPTDLRLVTQAGALDVRQGRNTCLFGIPTTDGLEDLTVFRRSGGHRTTAESIERSRHYPALQTLKPPSKSMPNPAQ